MTRRLSLVIIACLCVSCSTSNVREYLDDDTAATIVVAPGPWVFARERPDLAIHARDYITLTPMQVNRGGQRTIYLYCQLWSTIDRRDNAAIVPANSTLALIVDDRRIALPNSPTEIGRLGFGHAPIELPSKSAEVRIAAVDTELLRFVYGANQVRIGATIDDVTEYFVTWRDGHDAGLQFLQRIGGGRRDP